MQLSHVKSITQPNEGILKVTALCWSPNGKKIAVCTTERVVLMFDEEGKQKDKFSTKPCEKVKRTRRQTFPVCSSIILFYFLGTQKLYCETNGVQ